MKFKVGEICEARGGAHWIGWKECIVLCCYPEDDLPYCIDVCGMPDTEVTAAEHMLRKKQPPKQLDNQPCEEEFLDWFKKQFKEHPADCETHTYNNYTKDTDPLDTYYKGLIARGAFWGTDEGNDGDRLRGRR